MCNNPRRHFLSRLAVGGFALTPLAALLAGCGKSGWPEGMTAIKWDRDTCVVCSMVTVSYTHLDVYKRQILDGGACQ